jgi:adenylate cyclase
MKSPAFTLRHCLGTLPVAYKLGLLMSGLTVLILSTLWFIVSIHLTRVLEHQQNLLGNTIATQTAGSAAELVLAEDLLSLNVILSQTVQSDDIVFARIRDTKNKILAESGGGRFPLEGKLPDQLVMYTAAIHFQDVTAGYADIILDKTSMQHAITQSNHWMTIATLLLLAFSVLVAMILGKNLTQPILKLIHATDAIRQGDFELRLTTSRQDELGQLMHSFNEMADGLKERHQIKATFNRYLDPRIALQLMDNLENPSLPMGYTQASVLFVDIVSFTRLCEQAKPEQIARLLNIYYDTFYRCVSAFGGIIDKFMGDGAMALFGAPQADREHSFNAICASALFLELSQRFNQLTELQGLNTIEFRLGLHSGEVIAGSLGGKDRLQYTAVGDTVNIASRLCNYGEINRLTLSQASVDHAQGNSRLRVSDPYVMTVKGKQAQIQVCVLRALQPDHVTLINKRAKSLAEQLGLSRVLSRKLLKKGFKSAPLRTAV